ncbi:glycosyltransferase [Aeromonas hydrophila]
MRASEIKKENPNIITLVKLSRNFGLEGAIDAGLRVAKGDAVITMDADLQDPPSVILEMVKKWENGADIVVGSRSGRPNDSFFKKLTASFFYKLMDNLSGKLKLERSAANFRLLSRNALNIYLSLSEKIVFLEF